MQFLLLCTQWGMESLDIEDFLERVKTAGYDGIDTWVPETAKERIRLLRLLEEYQLVMVSHQHQAAGSTIDEFCRSMEYYLKVSAELNPVLINSHSGKDWFSFDDQLSVLDTAADFEYLMGIDVVHETHRGRMGFCPGNFMDLLNRRPAMKITADFSHWTCVTESFLEGFISILNLAIEQTRHVHARVGFTEGPQVPDPRSPLWAEAWQHFTSWWSQIIRHRAASGASKLTITPEFGPPPYMRTNLSDNKSISSQWEINLYIMQWFRNNFTIL